MKCWDELVAWAYANFTRQVENIGKVQQEDKQCLLEQTEQKEHLPLWWCDPRQQDTNRCQRDNVNSAIECCFDLGVTFEAWEPNCRVR